MCLALMNTYWKEKEKKKSTEWCCSQGRRISYYLWHEPKGNEQKRLNFELPLVITFHSLQYSSLVAGYNCGPSLRSKQHQRSSKPDPHIKGIYGCPSGHIQNIEMATQLVTVLEVTFKWDWCWTMVCQSFLPSV